MQIFKIIVHEKRIKIDNYKKKYENPKEEEWKGGGRSKMYARSFNHCDHYSAK